LKYLHTVTVRKHSTLPRVAEVLQQSKVKSKVTLYYSAL